MGKETQILWWPLSCQILIKILKIFFFGFDCVCRVKRVTKMTEKVATGVLSGVVKVSGFITGSVANSKVGKKFFGYLPGEIVLASLDGFSMLTISNPCVIYYNILAYISFLNGCFYSIKQLLIQKFINRCIIKSMKLMLVCFTLLPIWLPQNSRVHTWCVWKLERENICNWRKGAIGCWR